MLQIHISLSSATLFQALPRAAWEAHQELRWGEINHCTLLLFTGNKEVSKLAESAEERGCRAVHSRVRATVH